MVILDLFIHSVNAIIVVICQLLAMMVVLIGIAKAVKIYFRYIFLAGRSVVAVRQSRMELGYSFSLALGFLIGASILKTTLMPSWTDIGQLASIIAIRTILNYLLLSDISNQEESLDSRKPFLSFLQRRAAKCVGTVKGSKTDEVKED